MKNIAQHMFFFSGTYIDPGIQGAIQESPEPIPVLKNILQVNFIKISDYYLCFTVNFRFCAN